MPDVNMPKLSDTMEEGAVVEWRKSDGDAVKRGDVLAEVESDKATFELEAETDGELHIVAAPGAAVPVGDRIAVLTKPGETFAAAPAAEPAATTTEAAVAAPPEPAAPPATTAAVSPPEPTAAASTPATAAVKPAAPASANGPAASSGGARFKASPVAVRLAVEMGVDLRQIRGTGPDGRVVKEDVMRASNSPEMSASATSQTPGGITPAVGSTGKAGAPTVEGAPLTRLQAVIARRMVQSKTSVPHFYVTTEVRMDEAVKLQKQMRESVPGAEKLSPNDLVVRACALALRAMPLVNASWAEDRIQMRSDVNIGVAVAQSEPRGLVVPVIRNADTKDVVQISLEARALIERARANRQSPQDLEGGTFSISNLGMFGVTEFAAIVNPPESAILAIGAIREVPVVQDGEVVAGRTMKMTLSVDHRVFYGSTAGEFVAEVRRLLEAPIGLVLTR